MKTKKPYKIIGLCFLAFSLLAVACVSSKGKVDGNSAASDQAWGAGEKSPQNYQDGTGWSIELKGIQTVKLWQSYYDEAKKHSSHYVAKSAEQKGGKVNYRGMPLKLALAMIDGKDTDHAWLFDRELWASGYDVTFVAKDGYSATFNTKDLSPDALIIADEADGQPISPMIVGDSLKSLWVKDLAAIETSLSENALEAAAAAFALEVNINGAEASFSLKELESLPIYTEGRGAYTTSAGTRYEGLYAGVKLKDFLEAYTSISATDSVTFVAMDNYEMTYSGKTVLDQADGTWLLAFKLDGDYLPMDPGYVRTIKVGPKTPNIDGHNSVRMIKKIVVKQKDFVDFTLKLSGKMNFDHDRATIQSCASCHSKSVTFSHKGTEAKYSGFPLWLLLGYIDDAKYAPHKQDASIKTYMDDLANAGYMVDFVAQDGFKISLNSKDITRNDDIIVAMYKNGDKLPEDEFPLTIVWDKDSKKIPEGIKNIKKLSSVNARF